MIGGYWRQGNKITYVHKGPPKKRGRPKTVPKPKEYDTQTKEKMEMEALEQEIAKVDTEISKIADKYEDCRKLLRAGMVSIEAVKVTTQMYSYLNVLQDLKSKRTRTITDQQLASSTIGIANEPSMKKQKIDGDKCPGCNSNEVTDDPDGCFRLCMNCGMEFNKAGFCSDVSHMPKYGEGMSMSFVRNRIGGYKPLIHFGELVGRFQGARHTYAPEDIVKKIKDYCVRYKHEFRTVGPSEVRTALKMMQQDENSRIKNASAADVKANPYKRFTDYYLSLIHI